MQHLKRLFVIVNPVSGRGRVQKTWPLVRQALQDLGQELEIVYTERAGHAAELAEAHVDRADIFVAVGGDGTAHEVVNGLLRAAGGQATKPLAIIPLGNGDDFVKMLPPQAAVGQQAFSWEMAVEKIAAGQTAQYDVGQINVLQAGAPDETGQTCVFINGMNLGFTAHASYNFRTIPKFLTGSAGYLASVLKTLWKYPSLDLEIAFDDLSPESISTSMAAIMNGRCFGHSFWVAPQAAADDGLFDIMITKKVGRLTILQKVPLMLKGAHINDPLVSWRKASRMRISSRTPLIVEADGEVLFFSVTALQLTVLPGQLTMIV